LDILPQANIMRSLDNYIQQLQQGRSGLLGVAVELLLIGAVVYAALRFLQGTRGERLFKSFWLILFSSFLVVRLVAEKFDLERLNYIYPYFVSGVVLTTFIAFQPEIRRGLIRMGETRWLRSWTKENARVIEPVVLAVSRLSQKKIGALIAIQRSVGIDAVVESGVEIDGEITSELIETIFWPGSALHDLGVVIQHARITAAACQFPIAESGELDLSLGSRHRAALGLSHECDAFIIVVSEETGTISVAQGGRFQRGLTSDELRTQMSIALGQDRPVENSKTTPSDASSRVADSKRVAASTKTTSVTTTTTRKQKPNPKTKAGV
jgi:diadenylate cyclase